MSENSATAPQQGQLPASTKKLRVIDHLILSAFWFGTNLHWAALLLILIPKQSEEIAPAAKASAEGWILGIGSIMSLIVPLIAGALSDRCMSRMGRRRPFMLVGVGINLLGLAIMWGVAAYNPILPLYIIGYLVVQLGNNIAGAAYCGIMPDMVPEGERGEASGYMGAMTQIGSLVGIIVSGILLEMGQHGLYAYLMVSAVITALLGVTVFCIKERPLETPPGKLDWGEFLKSLWIDPKQYRNFFWGFITMGVIVVCLNGLIMQYRNFFWVWIAMGVIVVCLNGLIKQYRNFFWNRITMGAIVVCLNGLTQNSIVIPFVAWIAMDVIVVCLKELKKQYPDFFWVLITRALVMAGIMFVQPFLRFYLADVVQVDNVTISLVKLLCAILICATITGLFGGKISDKIGRKRVVYIANGLIAFAAVAFLFNRGELYTLFIGAIFGIGYGAYISVDWALGCDVLPDEKNDAAKDMGIWHVATVLPQSFAPMLAGVILGLSGQEKVAGTDIVRYHWNGYATIFTICAVFLVLGAVLLRNVRERKDRFPQSA